ncbi:hypothetical protein [Desulfogranum japonicum]|uniref:hypothetical protein n=1 Tax=Desulfogranum japonicum TaxID=231447 RepID=UPI000418D26D|nr:hypothetical protein [Desulfogranum japonicum]
MTVQQIVNIMKLLGQLKKRALHMVLVLGVLLSCTPCSTALGQDIIGRYKVKGNRIIHKIVIPQDPPAAVIVLQYLPKGTDVVKTSPDYSSYDKETGTLKWLFDDVQPGHLSLKITLAKRIDAKNISAEVLFLDQTGQSNIFSLSPLPMKRRAIEGC